MWFQNSEVTHIRSADHMHSSPPFTSSLSISHSEVHGQANLIPRPLPPQSSAYNIEKVGVAWGRRLWPGNVHIYIRSAVHKHAYQCGWAIGCGGVWEDPYAAAALLPPSLSLL